MVLLLFRCFLSGLVIFYGISFLLHAGNHGFGGAQVPIVVFHWSIPVVRSFTGLLSPFTRAAPFWGVVGASCVQTFLLLSVRHGMLTLYLPSLQILTASFEFFRSINWPIRGPLVLTLRPSLTCLSQPLLSPTLLGLRPCDRTLCLRRRHFSWFNPIASHGASFSHTSESFSPLLLPLPLINESVSVTWDPLGWHSRRLFARMARRQVAVLNQLFESSHLAVPSPDFPEPGPSEPHLVDSLDPALARIHLLMVERFDGLLHTAPPSANTVSLDIWATPSCHYAFPIIMELTYSLIAPTQDPPLIVDSGASWCISPCKQDFQSYSPSSAQIKD
jgi:hypothetical protein